MAQLETIKKKKKRVMDRFKLPVLPCYPCPHKGKCCSYGASVIGDEEKFIRDAYGDKALVWDEEENGWRTSVVNGWCLFHQEDGTCKIHSEHYYPKVCKLFPYEDVDGGPYKSDLDICPELK